jgi:uncharacterized protein
MIVEKQFTDRIQVIDVLRGFSLLGIVLVHMVEQYYAGPLPDSIAKAVPSSIPDQIVQGLVGLLIMGKFYMIFSFLFGLSFFIQFSKQDSESNFLLRFGWRLIVLFIIGMLHHLHYRGDILTIYALLGFTLLFLHRLPDKILLGLAIILILNIPTVITRSVALLFDTPPFNPLTDQPALIAYHDTLKSGSYFEILTANYFSFYGKMEFQILFGRLYITLGLFLLGIYAGRKGLFQNLSDKAADLKRARRYAWLGITACVAISLIIFGGSAVLKKEISQSVAMLAGGFLFDSFNTCLAVIYTTTIIVLFQKEKWNRRLMTLYPVGRMGLTTYLMQSAFGTMLFFNYGLGLLSEIGASLSFAAGLAFFVFQIFFARYWFHRFSYGPVEWFWRSLTYLKVQKLKLASA